MRIRPMLFVAGLLLALVPSIATAQQLVILVRHTERADAGMASKETDPLLSAAGAARADKLSTVLADAGIKAIYVTQFKRTQDTARPLAAKLNLATEPTPPTPQALVDQLKARHARDVVLVVGHSDTIPALVKALGGPVVTIAESEFDNIFLFVPVTGLFTRIHY